ncbi:MAG: hypothetical protein Q9222_001332 [Ikaeria aurantiellina]
MRLKVLYTFDSDNKTNCLARRPQNIDIRTAYLDETTQIGVIELKTCIQAIVAASPELVAKLGQDYTVYAYDYSEYDTPLVGQGMLSWVLASSSSTPNAPAHQSKTIVTGRVCKNIMGLFSDSTQETLEVKLRLVPVPTCLQSEYIESMKSYRDLSRVMPEGFDAQAWTKFLQANPGIVQLTAQSRSNSPNIFAGQKPGIGIENVQRLMHQNHGPSMDHSDQNTLSQSDSYTAAEAIEQLPRPLSQASSVRSSAPPKRGRGRPSKPYSELSESSRRSRRLQASRRESVDTGYCSHDEQQEDAQSRKRAKVTKADFSGSASFGKQPELRVAASAAASVRIHQPTAIRPSGQAANALEAPPREPTPIAGPPTLKPRPLLPARKSNLRCESFFSEASQYESPYQQSDTGKAQGSETSSPEGSRAESSNTPGEFASSPPAFPGSTTALSSPKLPTLPRDVDSGFMSGTMDDLFEDNEYRPLDEEDLDVAAQYMRRSDIQIQPCTTEAQAKDGGSDAQPDPMNPILGFAKESGTQSFDPGVTTSSHSTLNRTASSGSLAPPSNLGRGPLRPSSLQRSQTWAGHQENHPSSDTMMSSEAGNPRPKMRSRNRTGSGAGAKRKQAIQSKLDESVANGEMPPFCENCGEIETPTWRKAWIKVHSGSPEHVVLSEEDGGIVAWQTLQTDTNGQICLFRIIKRTLLPSDEGFSESLLCNPCGIWLHTRKCMRPKEVWDKTQGPDGGAGGPRKRSSQSKKGEDPFPSSNQTTTDNISGGSALYSDGSSPADTNERACEEQLPELSTRRQRASSVQLDTGSKKRNCLNEASATAALLRAIRSSPVQPRSVQHSTVTAKDLTPKPTRRILFPSPPGSGQHRALDDKDSNSTGKPSHSPKRQRRDTLDQADKENLPPQDETENETSFHEKPGQRSVTPTPSSKPGELLFKTPQRSLTPDRVPPTTGDFFSSAARALLRPHITPKGISSRLNGSQPLGEISPFTAQMNQMLSDVHATSPTGSNFDFPSLPSLNNTPGRVRHEFDFSHFDSQDLLSTDVPMASSPPVEGWFGVYEDPVERDGNFWNDFPFPGSSPPAPSCEGTVISVGRSPAELSVDAHGRATVGFGAVGKR